ncbi:MAG: substrate-binding domain-containing protein [Trebonia sp.]
MNNRRKALVTAAAGAVAAAALSASLSGCATADASAAAISADTTIEMIGGAQSDSFTLSMECGAAVEARQLGINLTVAAPQADTAADQLPLVQGLIVGNPDAVIISPAPDAGQSLDTVGAGSGGSLAQALYVAQENDTKVIFAGSSVADENVGASRVSANDADGGRIAADNLGKTLGEKGAVAVITAPDAGGPASTRIAAFRGEMAKHYPGITVLATQTDATDSAATAARMITGDLRAKAGPAAVLALTQNSAQGAINALGKAHKTGAVKLATFDASPFQMTGLTTGTIQLTVAREPAVEGADAVDQAVNAVAGKKVTPFISTPMVAITPRNMNDASIKPYIYDGTCTSSLRGFMTSGD